MASTKRRAAGSGQVLAAVLVLLVILATMVPVMVMYTQYEARMSEKQSKSTVAFHLAESGIEKGYRTISLSTATFHELADSGTQITDFKFDKSFSDVAGGVYTVSITSGPEEKQVTVISIGKVVYGSRTELRTVEAVFGQFVDDIAIQGMGGINVGGGVEVEWGAVISPKAITTGGRDFPQFKSAASIDLDTDGAAGTNCDQPGCCQWFSYSSDVPSDPGISLAEYRTAAEAMTGCAAGGTPTGSCYYASNQNWTTFSVTNKTVYINGNLVLSQKLNVIGNIIIIGDLSVPNGTWGDGDPDMPMPQEAWKQYCRNWSHYVDTFTEDTTEPAEFPGLGSGYKSSNTITPHNPVQAKTAVSGFMYVGGNLNSSGGGGGNTRIYGSLFVLGTVTLSAGSSVTVYYNKTAAKQIKTTKLNLKRVSWQAKIRNWPL